MTDYPDLGGSGSFVPGSASSFDSNSRILVNGSQFDNGNSNGPGNLTTMGGYTYSYDGENRMVSSHLNSTTTYAYDGEGRRVQMRERPRLSTFMTPQGDWQRSTRYQGRRRHRHA